MDWMIPAVIANMSGTVILALMYFYLYWEDRQRHLLIWAVSWCIYVIRYVFLLIMLMTGPNPYLLAGNQLAALVSGVVLLRGTFVFLGKPFSRLWFPITGCCALYIIAGAAAGFSMMLISLPTFTFLAWIYAWTGITLIRASGIQGMGRNIVGWVFILWGIHKADYPFLRPVSWFAPWGYLLGAVFEIAVAIGMLIIYFQRMRGELTDSERKYRQLFESLQDVYYRTDMDGRFLLVSPSAQPLVGYPIDEILGGMTNRDLFARPEEWERFRDRLLAAGKAENAEIELIHKDGSRLWVSTNVAVVRDDSGAPVGMEGMARDVTEVRRAREERAELESQLRQSQKMEAMGRLAGGIAHDFNNILASIIGFTELCLEDSMPGTLIHDNLREVMLAGRRAKYLVQQILTFTRKNESEIRPVRVGSVLTECLNLLRAILPSTIEIRKDIRSDASVMGDPTRIHQVIVNLCTNARDAMKADGGTLAVSLEMAPPPKDLLPSGESTENGSYVRLRVADSGQGMPPEILERIFDPYYSTKQVGEGTGMGLSVVQGIVRSAGGFVTVESSPGAGAVFDVYLPVAENNTASDEMEHRSVASGGGERILVVDDDVAIIGMIQQMLTRLGYETKTYAESLAALEAFKRNPDAYDLVITDMTMPGITGDRLAWQVMAIRPDLPVILCTGYSDRVDVNTLARMGIRTLLMKPIEKHELAETIRRALNHRRNRNPAGSRTLDRGMA